jgi:hypothetical protein
MRHDLTLTTLDGAETVILSVPTSWADVTLQQFIDWQCSDRPAIEVLGGITTEQLHRLGVNDAGYLLNLLAFAVELPDPPVTPGLKDVGEASYGQMVLATQYLQQHPDKPLIWCAPYLYALYRSREVFGQHSDTRMAEMEAAIRLEPVDVVLGDVLFTLGSVWLSLSSTLPTPSPLPKSPRMTRWMRAWKRFWSSSAKSSPSTASPPPSA